VLKAEEALRGPFFMALILPVVCAEEIELAVCSLKEGVKTVRFLTFLYFPGGVMRLVSRVGAGGLPFSVAAEEESLDGVCAFGLGRITGL